MDGPGNQISCTGEQQCKHDEVEDQRLWNTNKKKIVISNGNRTEWSTIQGVIGESFQIGRARSARLI